MLTQQTINKLSAMKLNGMSKGFEEQLSSTTAQGLSFEERFGMLVDQSRLSVRISGLKRLLKTAKLKCNACKDTTMFTVG